MTLPFCNMFLIGLLQGRGHICGMMTIMMIMVIIRLLGDDNDDKFFKWYDDYKKRKSQKVQIKDKLLSIVWHPSRWQDWCVPEDKKKQTENLWK